MAQHDYVIANDTAANVRADINNALAAVASNNSGATQPTTMYANEWWYDTATDTLKIRAEANDAWISVALLNQTTDQAFPIVGGVTVTSTGTELNLVDGSVAGTIVNSKAVVYGAAGQVNATTLQIAGTSITATAAELNFVGGVTSAIQTQLNAKAALASPALTGTPTAPTATAGTNTTQLATTAFVKAAVDLVTTTYGTEVAATSGTAIGFTGIPSSATRITMILEGVVTSGNDTLLVQLGTSAGYIATGYVGAYFTQGGNTSLTTGLGSINGTSGAANSGAAVWYRTGTGNDWVGTMTIGNTSNSSAAGARIAAAAAVDRIRVTTAGGALTFTAGAINIFWE
jgi:hypothetical protein